MMKGKGIISKVACISLVMLIMILTLPVFLSEAFADKDGEDCAYASEAASPSDACDIAFYDDVPPAEPASPSEAVMSHGSNVTPPEEDMYESVGEAETILPDTGGIGSFWPVLAGLALMILGFSVFSGKVIKLFSFALLLTLILPSGKSALAAVPENGQAGSVTVCMIDEETLKPVSGGELTLYRAARITLKDGVYIYSLTEDFADSGIKAGELNSTGLADAALARKLADFAIENELVGTTLPIGENGLVRFDMVLDPLESEAGLPNGLYLFAQDEAAFGYYPVSPFLVTVPLYNKDLDMYVYEIDAAPKTRPLQRKPDELPEDSKPQTDVEETQAESSPEETETGADSEGGISGTVAGGGSGHNSGSHSGGSKTYISGDNSGDLNGGIAEENMEWDTVNVRLSPTGQGHLFLAAVCILAFSGFALTVVAVRWFKKKEKK